jgi:hypothetical protein
LEVKDTFLGTKKAKNLKNFTVCKSAQVSEIPFCCFSLSREIRTVSYQKCYMRKITQTYDANGSQTSSEAE